MTNPAGHTNDDVTAKAGPDAPRRGQNLAYVPALDGVRAVAIIVILGYHGGVYLTTGGFYSLDTFFALSGFLITSLLIAEWRTSATVRLKAFWARRARRLLPALLLMLLGVAAFAAFAVPRGTYPTLRTDSLSALFYFANWHFIAAGSNYFNQTALTSPLTHTWSLAVEEQFYLVWPLIFLFVMKRWRSLRVLLAVCVAGALASAVEMALLYSPGDVNRVYYGTDTRAQSLLIGAALAAALAMWAQRRGVVGDSKAAPSAGPLVMAAGLPLAPRTVPGRIAVLFVGLAGVVRELLVVDPRLLQRRRRLPGRLPPGRAGHGVRALQRGLLPGSPLAWLLSVRPLRFIGRISYGLYLWHFPLFIYIDNARTGLEGFRLFALRVAATLVIAVASFYLVERPIRQGTLLSGWRAWAVTPISVAATRCAAVGHRRACGGGGPAPAGRGRRPGRPSSPGRGSRS